MLEQAGFVLQDNSCKARENPVKIESIIEKLTEEYSGERDKIEKDVLKFLEKLEKERIIKIVS